MILMTTLADTANGGTVGIWVVFAIFLIVSVTLLSGHGGCLIAGYNVASKEEKAKIDEKKLCRTFGAAMMVVTILILIMLIFMNVLPESFAYVALVIVFVDVAVALVVANLCCKKKEDKETGIDTETETETDTDTDTDTEK